MVGFFDLLGAQGHDPLREERELPVVQIHLTPAIEAEIQQQDIGRLRLCQRCLKAGKFQKKGWLVLGFFCFNLGFIGDFLPLWFTKESYLEYAAQMMDPGSMATMEGLLTWPVFGVIVLSILVGSILGALLGMKLMRKHFVKAGLAQ